jgi:hypothetical protein
MFRSALMQRVEVAEDAITAAVAALDPDDIPASEAVRLYEGLERIVRTATAARVLLARRVDDSMAWRRKGFRSAAEFLASTSGTSLGAAKTDLETSNALRDLAETRRGMLDGSLSPDQGGVIAGAAKRNRSAERNLIKKAKKANLQELREEAAKAKAAADPSPEATHARLHRERRATAFTDAEGARNLRLRGPVDSASVIQAELDRLTDQIFRERGKAGTTECRDAYAYDAAVEMARRSARADDAMPTTGGTRAKQPRPEHLALLRLDISAMWRGHVEGDELCEITGLGPIPVGVARRLLGDALLKLVITNGQAVAHVTSLTRGPTQAMKYTRLWTSPTCLAEGCSRTIVEYDHRTGAEYKDTRHTRLDELDPLCSGHHDLHTYEGWALVAGTGKRPMVPPDDPRHPRNTGPPGTGPPGDRWSPPEAESADGRESPVQADLFA